MISIIVAHAMMGVIGKDGKLPWKLPADMQYFKETTMGKTVVMGRKTYESIGRPLPGRDNIVVTSQAAHIVPPITPFGTAISFTSNIDWIVEMAKSQEVFVIGGANIYEQFLPHADRIYVTDIKEFIEGDTYFPAFWWGNDWELVSYKKGIKDEKNPYDYGFYVHQRKS